MLIALVGLSALPIAAKWLLIGRFKEEAFPVWSLRYFRFWAVKALIRSSPMAALRRYSVPEPLPASPRRKDRPQRRDPLDHSFRSPQISSPSATTLSSDKDSVVVGYKAQANMIHIAPISIGANSFVGDASVLDIETEMEDGTQLGHASSLQRGQGVPSRQALSRLAGGRDERQLLQGRAARVHGASSLALCVASGCACDLYRAGHSRSHLQVRAISVSDLAAEASGGAAPSVTPPMVTSAVLGLVTFIVSLVAIGTGLASVILIPRLLSRLVPRNDRPTCSTAVHYFVSRLIGALSNVRFFNLSLATARRSSII